MTYRDEREALQARLDRAEAELEEARTTIERLKGGAAAPPPDDIDPWTGVGRYLRLERELAFEVSDEGFVAIADALNRRIPGGHVSQVGSTLVHRKGTYELKITRGRGRTRFELTGDYRSARQNLLLGTPGLAILGSTLTGGLGVAISDGQPVVVAIAALVGVFAGFFGLRALQKRALEKDRQTLAGALECALALAHRPSPRHRIAPHDGEADARAAEDEAVAAGEVDQAARGAR